MLAATFDVSTRGRLAGVYGMLPDTSMQCVVAQLLLGTWLFVGGFTQAPAKAPVPDQAPERSHVERFSSPREKAERAESEATAALHQKPTDVDALAKRGAARIQLGRLDGALADFRRAVDLAPNQADLLTSYGYVLAALNRRAEAQAAFERAIVVDSNAALAHYHLGKLLINSGADVKAGIVHLERTLTLRPDLTDVRFDLMMAYRLAGDTALAAAQLRYLKEAKPRDIRVTYAEGILASDRGDLATAVDRFEAVLRAEPGLETARRDLALALLRSERWSEAEPALEHLVVRFPDSAELAYLRALALFNLGRLDEAAAATRVLVARFPKVSDAQTLLGLVLTGQGAPAAEVIAAFQAAVDLNPASFDAQFYLGRARYGDRDYDGAVAALAKAVELKPDHVKARFFYATALENAGSADAALAQYEELARRAPDSPEGYVGLGAVLGKRGQFDEALAALGRAIALDDHLFEAQYAYGRACARSNRIDDAIAALQRAVALEPNRSDAHYQLGLVLRRAGRTDEATTEFQTVERLNAEFRNRTPGMGQP